MSDHGSHPKRRDCSIDLDAALSIVTEGAHEIRTQLGILLLELGKIDHANVPKIEIDVRIASETVNRIALLYTLATTEIHVARAVGITDIVRGIVGQTETCYPERLHRIEVRDCGGIRAVQGNRAFITEAIRGLLDNAGRHTPLGSRIVIRCSADDSVTIDDDGPGLSTSVQRRFGMPFVRGQGPAAGVGLGFAIADQVARLHGGRCRLVPSELGGACVCISFVRSSEGGDDDE